MMTHILDPTHLSTSSAVQVSMWPIRDLRGGIYLEVGLEMSSLLGPSRKCTETAQGGMRCRSAGQGVCLLVDGLLSAIASWPRPVCPYRCYSVTQLGPPRPHPASTTRRRVYRSATPNYAPALLPAPKPGGTKSHAALRINDLVMVLGQHGASLPPRVRVMNLASGQPGLLLLQPAATRRFLSVTPLLNLLSDDGVRY